MNWWEQVVRERWAYGERSQEPIEPLPEDARCPACGGRVEAVPSCPGYRARGDVAIMVCQPEWACGNATEFRCLGEGKYQGCGWWYREPNNRGDRWEMGPRPGWADRYLI